MTFHLAANDQNERVNQLIKIAFQCLLVDKYKQL